MKTLQKDIRSGIVIGLSFLSTVLIGGMIYAAIGTDWTNPSTIEVRVGSGLTASSWNTILADLNNLDSRSVPTGAVMAFNLTTCPTNWSQADGNGGRPDLRGQFIRGLNTFDNGATTRSDGKQDPDTRSIDSWQADIFKSHNHPPSNTQNGFMSNTYPDSNIGNSGAGGGFIGVGYQMATTGDRGGLETRPRNVALIYCVKN